MGNSLNHATEKNKKLKQYLENIKEELNELSLAKKSL